MTDQTKQLVSDAKTIEEKIKAANNILKDAEPINISIDNFSGFTGYKPQYIFDALNAAFHIGGWGFEEVSTETISKEDKTPSLAICQVKVWLKGIDFQPVGWGQGRITKGDIGDGKKSAQTDAIKKHCLTSP